MVRNTVVMSLVYLSSLLLLFYTHAKIIVPPNVGMNLDSFLNRIPNSNLKSKDNESVKVQVYYETLCEGCKTFDTTELIPAITKLGKHLDVNTYPFGNGEIIDANGKIIINCQHGEKECYGNKLHACALDIIKNKTEALIFNACMMDDNQSNGKSDDEAAQTCAASKNQDSKAIIACANGEKGTQLLKYYGDESKKADFHYVPYSLINGKASNPLDDFMSQVCQAFKNPPPECKK